MAADSTAALLTSSHDLIEDRTFEGPALDVRGWRAFLLALDDTQLDVLEGGGVWPNEVPASLRAFVGDVHAACALPSLGEAPTQGRTRPHESPRKHAQVDAFARILTPLLQKKTARVVDIGSGHGHLTREIAARLDVPVVGVERDAALVARARALAGDDAMFAQADVVRDGFAFSRDDVVIGLHACGELGDALVLSAARVGASVALIGCCLQKRRALARDPLSDAGVTVERDVLGLSNLTARDDGVEASRADNLAARERRLALRRLLEQAGADLPRIGAEIAGLNRRAAHDELAVFVERAFAARSLPLPSSGDIDAAAAWARTHHAQQRRLQLPRTMLARVLEVHVALDRARHLSMRGGDVRVGTAFDDAVSARNVMITSSR